MGTERGLFEKPRNKSVIFDIIDVLLLKRALPAPQPQSQLAVGFPEVLASLVLGHLLRVPLAPQSAKQTQGMRSRSAAPRHGPVSRPNVNIEVPALRRSA